LIDKIAIRFRKLGSSSFDRTMVSFFVLFLFITLLFVAVVPGSDFDSMAVYIAELKIRELGPLSAVATTELQRIFPDAFNTVFLPFLKLNWFYTLPNYLLGLACLWIVSTDAVIREEPRVRHASIVLIFACQPFLVALMSFKNDLSMAAIALIGWACISRLRSFVWYLPICLASISMLVGIKWLGIILAVLLFCYLVSKLLRSHRPSKVSVLISVVLSPLFYLIGSGDSYLRNYREYGSFLPSLSILPYADSSFSGITINFYKFFATSVLNTFDPIFYVVNHWVKRYLLVSKLRR
jgi:hypothetical protein